ncbi:hypothetical protein HMPREF0673_01908 [Leyella stercorea DSM 18206]|uniref:Uncharacterized protein n=1 Tax=Leyella stercorea DSM 18206 TaxID=1002367 RepID=G6AZ44_9BACT|nr:hypothetical protein HMPREF0673_01908 [Leyella stercorea DSM 18206]
MLWENLRAAWLVQQRLLHPLNFCEFRGFRGRTDSRRVNSVGGITFVFV